MQYVHLSQVTFYSTVGLFLVLTAEVVEVLSVSWSRCCLLAALQHDGADMEADVGGVLLLTEPWDVTLHLF